MMLVEVVMFTTLLELWKAGRLNLPDSGYVHHPIGVVGKTEKPQTCPRDQRARGPVWGLGGLRRVSRFQIASV
jgi:hypothetical protein